MVTRIAKSPQQPGTPLVEPSVAPGSLTCGEVAGAGENGRVQLIDGATRHGVQIQLFLAIQAQQPPSGEIHHGRYHYGECRDPLRPPQLGPFPLGFPQETATWHFCPRSVSPRPPVLG